VDPAKAVKEEINLRDAFRECKELVKTTDLLTSKYTQMASSFLLFANAYPKHAPLCCILADSCFTMAKLSSHLLSASWKFLHPLTMSSMTSDLDIIISPLNTMSSKIGIPLSWYIEIYNILCKHVKTEREELFPTDCKQPPPETQISAFLSSLDDAQAMVNETLKQMKQLVPPEGDASEQKVRPGPSSVGDECAGAKMKNEDSEAAQKLRGFEGSVDSFVGDLDVFLEILRNLNV
jgi:hypothetical protein